MLALPLVVTIVASAAVHGTPEPCGCNSDPLGDVARVATLAKGGVWVDAGSLLFDPELSVEARTQAEATAGELAKIYAGADVGLGAADLKYGAKAVAPARQACNARGIALAAPRVRSVGGVGVGVFGVVAPSVLKAASLPSPRPGLRPKEGSKLKATDPVPAAKQAIANLRRQKAQVIVMLAGGMDRNQARALLTQLPGVNFAIVGADVDEGMSEPERIGDAWLMAPAEQLKRVVKLTVNVVDAKQPLPLFVGEAAQRLEKDRADKRIATLAAQLKQWQEDPSADQTFVKARRQELDDLKTARAKLELEKPTPPTGNYFSYELVPMRHVIPRDEGVAKELRELAQKIGRVNLQLAGNLPAPPVEKGQPEYVGMQACGKCHKPAVDFWKTTVHAQAWQTLVDVDKQYHYDCIGCHVVGWEKAGGSSLGTVEKRGLVDVQCEVCHGPASLHVAEAGLEDPKTLTRKPPDRFCADNCHTREHSDTFDLVPYLRDILGKGHGEKARAALGNGPTGHQLRTAALKKAGRME